MSPSLVIKIAQSRTAQAMWGDFYYAYSLKKALNRFGWKARVAFRDELHDPVASEIVLLGLDMHEYVPAPGTHSIAWLISHPNQNTPQVLSRYRKAYVSSLQLAREWGFEYLGQAFDSDVHFPPLASENPRYPVAFVGNARAGDRLELIALLDGELQDFHLWGNAHQDLRNWHGPLPWLRTGEVFRASSIVVGHNTALARASGVANDRMHAVIACGAFLLSDEVSGIHELFPELICYKSPRHAVDLCYEFLRNAGERDRIAYRCTDHNRQQSFDERATVIHRELT